MKAVMLVFLFIILCEIGFTQRRQKQYTPPGTVQINDTLFADRTEISNVGYREFLYWLASHDSLKVESMLPDSLVWNDTIVSNENPFTQYYFRHPGFNTYPVVGISYEQALAFCEWRTLAVNYYIFCKENKCTKKSDFTGLSFPIKVKYRLPTKQEWEMISSGKLEVKKFPYGFDRVEIKWKGTCHHRFNCIYPNTSKGSNKGGDKSFYTSYTKSYFPNSHKLYNTIGNVAEMVSEKGIAKGGSFAHKLEECRIANNQSYTKPEGWLGFRCVAVMIR